MDKALIVTQSGVQGGCRPLAGARGCPPPASSSILAATGGTKKHAHIVCYRNKEDIMSKEQVGTYTITILPGDGIGPEVTEQAVRVLQAVASRYGHTFSMTWALVGLAAIEAEGAAISNATM